jgi:hypothetical protein
MYDVVLIEAGSIILLHRVVEVGQLAREGTYND